MVQNINNPELTTPIEQHEGVQALPEATSQLKTEAPDKIRFCEDRANLAGTSCETMIGEEGIALVRDDIKKTDEFTTQQMDTAREERDTESSQSYAEYQALLSGRESKIGNVAEAVNAGTQGDSDFNQVGAA